MEKKHVAYTAAEPPWPGPCHRPGRIDGFLDGAGLGPGVSIVDGKVQCDVPVDLQEAWRQPEDPAVVVLELPRPWRNKPKMQRQRPSMRKSPPPRRS